MNDKNCINQTIIDIDERSRKRQCQLDTLEAMVIEYQKYPSQELMEKILEGEKRMLAGVQEQREDEKILEELKVL